MNCKQISSDLQLYIDDELPNAEQAELQAHLTACPECEALYMSGRLLKNFLKEKIIRKTATQSIIDNVRDTVLLQQA